MTDKTITTNKKAFHEYFIVETLECGIKLEGCEVKSIRRGEINLTDSFCLIKNGEIILTGCYIKNYDKASYTNVDSRRDRKLLAHKRETARLLGKVKQKGYSVVPLEVYFKQSLVKVKIALVKGKLMHDKRDSLMEKDLARDAERAVKEYS